MTAAPSPTLAASIAAARQWWVDAGVEIACGDEPSAWAPQETGEELAIAGAQPARPDAREEPTPPPPPPMGGDRAAWPADLAAFGEWWLTEPSIDCGGLRPRIAPRGGPRARLMVLVPMPEAEDEDRLLAGAQGRLVMGIGSALGLAEDDIYLASALPRHVPVPEWERLQQAGLGAIVHHHIALAAPERLLVMGNSILPLLGHSSAQDPPDKGKSAIQGSDAPVLGTLAPETLLRAARSRAALWRQLLDWTEA